jgi:hypothetical protein
MTLNRRFCCPLQQGLQFSSALFAPGGALDQKFTGTKGRLMISEFNPWLCFSAFGLASIDVLGISFTDHGVVWNFFWNKW